MWIRSNNKILIIFLSLLTTLVLIYNFKIAFEERYNGGGDDLDYVYLATGLAKTGVYGYMDRTHPEVIQDYKDDIVDAQVYKNKNYASWRAPLWPYTMAAILYIFGYKLTYVIVFKLLIHVIEVYFFHKCLKFLNIKGLLLILGTFIFSISPVYQIYSRVFYAEPLTSFFLGMFVFSVIYWFKKGKNGFLIPLTSALLVLTHPYFIFLPFSIFGVLFLQKQTESKIFMIFSVLAILLISAWPLRNAIILETNSYVITTSSGPVMAKGWNKDVVQEHTNTKGDLANEGIVFENYISDKIFYGGAAQSQKYQDAVFQFIEKNPNQILPIIFTKLKSAFNPLQETYKPGYLETGRELFHAISLICLILILFEKKSIIKSLGVGLILSTVAITILTYSGFRFRAPQFFLELLVIFYIVKTYLQRYVITP
ncbi:hypothetical protein [Leeuwenhoekiella sp. MAR_2009_132]|uniref:hypothetical protein n=1 Tax=Leeuwenhoekiella sp. MAR_2009_132 TaxID=1392489 RepID=UPI00048DEFC6|nr:hypothetical protein [Leeuwenhoekiella sp. MAR_2009_132]